MSPALMESVLIKFECKGCSGCCHGGISVTLTEAIGQYYRYFPFIGIFSVADVRNVPVEKDKDAYSKSMKDFSKNHLSFYTKTKDGRKIVVHPQIVSLNHPELPCVNLDEDKLCSIYSFKPKACSLYPFRVDTPVVHMEKGLLRERQRAFEEEEYIPCGGWKDTEELIFSTKGPSDASVVDLFKLRGLESKETTKLLKMYFECIRGNEQGVENKIMKYSSLNDNSSNVIQFNVAELLCFLRKEGKISSSYLLPYINGQIESYKNLISLLKGKNNENYNLILNVAKVQLKELCDLKEKEV